MILSTVSDIAITLLTLTFLEIVLGVDNLVFISIISRRLPKQQQKIARRFGLILALISRLVLLASALWVISLKKPILTIFNFDMSGRDLFLLGGGLFLLYKGTREIHAEYIGEHSEEEKNGNYAGFGAIVTQIAILDIVFSLDSIFTAVGLTQQFWIMAAAIVITIILMIIASEPLSRLIMKLPTIRMLALSFLLLIGTILIADGLHFHVPRQYVYFALAFSVMVESLNLLVASRRKRHKNRMNNSKKK